MFTRVSFSKNWVLQCGGKTIAKGNTVRETMRDVTLDASKIEDYQLYAPNGARLGILTAVTLLE